MNNQIQQIIPNSQAVASCLNPSVLDALDSHSTFTISELFEAIKLSDMNRTSYRNELRNMIEETQCLSLNVPSIWSRLIAFLDGDEIRENRLASYEILREALLNGTECNLLQSDGKGWQKGELKICFEFIPEKNEPIITQENTIETTQSQLDEIRQLTNSLPIEQN
jgi:hypothetical protein